MVDDAKLESTILELLTKDQELLQQHASITEVVMALKAIQMDKKPKFDQSTGAKTTETIDVAPTDPLTKETISEERRQQIYDLMMPKVKVLLK